MNSVDRLGGEKYVRLTTYRKDGRAVGTPVWVVRDGAGLGVWTNTDSGKVKRIRRNGDVTLEPCDFRGRPHGEAVSARATIADDASTARIRNLVRRKYGLLGRLIVLGNRLRHGPRGAVGIHLLPTE